MCSDGLRWTDSTSLKSCTHPGPPGARASCTPSADAAARLLRQGCCSGRSLFTDVGICSAASSTTEGASSRLEFGRSADATAGLTGEATNSISGQGQQQSEWQQEASQREARRQLLESALKHVKEQGWTLAAVQAAARDLGLSPAIAASLERGPAELVEHFVLKSNEEFAAQAAQRKGDLENMRLKERIAQLLRWRLELTAPYVDSWPQAMALQALPTNAGNATKQLALLVDDIWHAAGDTATDYSWYTKRGLLAGVYTSTELYMLTDYSPGMADTWQAMDRRIADVMRLGRLSKQMGQAAQQGAEGFWAMASWMQDRMHAQRGQQPAP